MVLRERKQRSFHVDLGARVEKTEIQTITEDICVADVVVEAVPVVVTDEKGGDAHGAATWRDAGFAAESGCTHAGLVGVAEDVQCVATEGVFVNFVSYFGGHAQQWRLLGIVFVSGEDISAGLM
jgi:hypothetical protein